MREINKCFKCLNMKQEELIETDEFGKLKVSVYYCKECFLEQLKQNQGNFNSDECSVCDSQLQPVINEDLFDEGIVFYTCPNQNEELSHDEYGEYILQPKEE
jgi:peptide subunit release factor 1 (eRF1)